MPMGLFGPSPKQRREIARNNLHETVSFLEKCKKDLGELAKPDKCWDDGHTNRFLELFRNAEICMVRSEEEATKINDKQLVANIERVRKFLEGKRKWFESAHGEARSKSFTAFLKEYWPEYEGYLEEMGIVLENSISGIKLILAKNLW